MYHCVCHTCLEEKLVEEFDRAQEYFNDHADGQCEVELLRVTSTRGHPIPVPTNPDASAEDTRPTHD